MKVCEGDIVWVKATVLADGEGQFVRVWINDAHDLVQACEIHESELKTDDEVP